MNIGKITKDGMPHYTVDMVDDLEEFLDDWGMLECKPVLAPMPDKYEITRNMEPVSEQQHRDYRSQVGSLAWYANTNEGPANQGVEE